MLGERGEVARVKEWISMAAAAAEELASGSWTAAATKRSKAETAESHRTASIDFDCGKRWKYSPVSAITPSLLGSKLNLREF